MAGTLTLGEVTFQDFEVPERFNIGGKQSLVIHTLPGGTRVVDAMGPDDAAIRWSGYLSGPNAADRARTLEKMRRGGVAQTLVYETWRYIVMVQDFDANIMGNQWIPYRIQLCIIQAAAVQASDWLDGTQPPVLTVGLQTAAVVEAAITTADVSLASSDVGEAMTAAGLIAQYKTAQIYGLFEQ